MRSVVLVHGVLRGMGQEVPCELLAIREAPSAGAPPIFSRCNVIEAPREMPDGDYTVTFSGYIVPARREGGLWLPDDRAVTVRTEQRPLEQERPFRTEDAAEILPILKPPRDRVA